MNQVNIISITDFLDEAILLILVSMLQYRQVRYYHAMTGSSISACRRLRLSFSSSIKPSKPSRTWRPPKQQRQRHTLVHN
jgi:hypothetical protein